MAVHTSQRSWLGRMPVGRQLYGVFFTLLVLTAMLGAVAPVGLARVDAQTLALSGKWLQGVGHLSPARATAVETRDQEIKHSRATDKSDHAEYEDKAVESAKAVETALAAHDGLTSVGFDETLGSLNKLSDFNFEGGRTAAVSLTDVYQQSRLLVAGLMVAALVVGIGLAALLTRHLIAQPGGEPHTAVEVAQAVAGGDLATRIHLRTGDARSRPKPRRLRWRC